MTVTNTAAGHIRRCVEADVPQITALYRRVWGALASPEVGDRYFAEVLLHNPCSDGALGSLVCEDAEGRLIGCLGVMPRWMAMRGRRVRVAVSHNFMVEPGSRSTLAAVKLLRRYFAGAQELSIAEGNDGSRALWEALGGTTALLYSIRWSRVLRPAGYLLRPRAARGRIRFGCALRPLAGLADAMACRIGLSPFHQPRPRLPATELAAETVLAGLGEVTAGSLLRPEYDAHSLPWLLWMLERKRGRGTFRARAVRRGGATVGWYLYYAASGGVGEVVQVAAREGAAHDVLDHLFHDAWRHGMVGLSGQLQPQFLRAFSDRQCFFRHGGAWMLVHSRDPDLLHAIHRGQGFLTRLDGEWWINP